VGGASKIFSSLVAQFDSLSSANFDLSSATASHISDSHCSYYFSIVINIQPIFKFFF
jgi:hypothetical protein